MKIICSQYPSRFLKFKIKRVFNTAMKVLGQPSRLLEVELNFVEPDEIKRLNEKHRSVVSVTDVLSFPLLELKAGKHIDASFITAGQKKIGLGSIVICTPIAAAQAEKFGHSFKREVCFLALHGLLHLLGFDHVTNDGEEMMMLLADRILSKNKVTREENKNAV